MHVTTPCVRLMVFDSTGDVITPELHICVRVNAICWLALDTATDLRGARTIGAACRALRRFFLKFHNCATFNGLESIVQPIWNHCSVSRELPTRKEHSFRKSRAGHGGRALIDGCHGGDRTARGSSSASG
jgi:hypothetical protein